jgi:hypothetical protein
MPAHLLCQAVVDCGGFPVELLVYLSLCGQALCRRAIVVICDGFPPPCDLTITIGVGGEIDNLFPPPHPPPMGGFCHRPNETGQCNCAGGAYPVQAGKHGAFTCAAACAGMVCEGWKQTTNCGSTLEPANNKNCSYVLPLGVSGFCECSMGIHKGGSAWSGLQPPTYLSLALWCYHL